MLRPRYSFSFISRNPGLTNMSSVMVLCRQPDMSLPMNLRRLSQPVKSSINVRYSSKVVTVCGSNWIWPNACMRCFCFRSILKCRTHPRRPQGSRHDIRMMSSAILRNRLAGSCSLQWCTDWDSCSFVCRHEHTSRQRDSSIGSSNVP